MPRHLRLCLTIPASFLVRCKSCGFIFCSEIPSNDELEKFYSRYPVSESLSALTAKRYDEWLDKFESFRKLNTILDVGCGDGYFLERAIKKRVEGFWNRIYRQTSKSRC
jgi:SAM-dependent methyltransferase